MSEVRLIDANALIEKVWDADTRIGYVQVVDRGDIEAAPTIDHAYGFPLEHLAFIARVMEQEGVTPGEVAALLRYVGKISKIVVDAMQKVYEKSIREAVHRIDDDPSHPFADGVMMKE